MVSTKNYRTAWRSLGGQKINILPYYIIARDNNLKLKLFVGKKLTKEVNAKKYLESKPTKFFGAPCNSGSWSQNAWTFLQNIHILLNISSLNQPFLSKELR